MPKENPNYAPPLPTSLPDGLKGTKADVPALRKWLIQRYSSTTFNVCEHQPLPMMNCVPLKLHMNPDAKPTAVHRPAMIPIHWQEKVYSDLERDVRLGVLEKVNPNTPVTWCSRMVVTSKADGTPRRTVDLQPQNRESVRQTHHVPTPFKLAEAVPQGTVKTVTDAWNGYHSVPLCEEDRHFTTFITPWGRYRYRVAPQGFIASGDAYNQRFDSIIAEFPNKVKCVDDTCMWAPTIEEAFYQTCKWLDLCGKNGITLNPKKFQFAEETVDFAGLTITPTSIKPCAKFLKSIAEFPTPKDITGARAWFGLINQGAYAFSIAKRMKPFRELLKPSNKFEWTEQLNKLFLESKEVITNAIKDGVRLFDPRRPTCLATDWSVDGIGFTLKQKYCKCKKMSPSCCLDGWHICLVGSRFTTSAESRYAPVEGEALAVAYALHQTRYYISGCSTLIVATDHKPLIQIFNDRSLTDISNRRLLNLKEKTLPYSFTIQHISGAKNKGPDAMSRYPPPSENEAVENLADDISIQMEAETTLYVATNIVTWEMIQTATAEDNTLQHLKQLIVECQEVDRKYSEVHPPIRPYLKYVNQMSVVDGVIMMGQRIVVPHELRSSILQSLHAAHQGITVMSQRAADTVFWPGITIDISRTREQCEHCHRIAKSNAMQPPEVVTPPEYPFQRICADYFQHSNNNYLVIVDRYSNWPTVFREGGKAENLISRLRDFFETFGVPEELTSDGGPQFTAGVTVDFLKSWGVHHRITSVGNPHANARAEIAVKTIKRMLMANTLPSGSLNSDAFKRAMLIYRNSIDPFTKSSPAMAVFGRPIRDPIPAPLGRYCPHKSWEITAEHRETALAKRHAREREKWSANTKELKDLQIGDHVYLQNLQGNNPLRWERTGVIVEIKPFQQYTVKIDGSGRVTLRNRKHLRKFTPFQKERIFIPVSTVPTPTINLDKENISTDSGQRKAPELNITRPDTGSPVPVETPDNTAEEVVVPQSEQISLNPEPTTTTSQPRVPLALRRLQAHNKAGLKET